jgi:hypothetical protein
MNQKGISPIPTVILCIICFVLAFGVIWLFAKVFGGAIESGAI